jgi:hypothetical protein
MEPDETQIVVKKKRFERLRQSLQDGRRFLATLDDDCPELHMVKPVCSTLEDDPVKIPKGALVRLNPNLLK